MECACVRAGASERFNLYGGVTVHTAFLLALFSTFSHFNGTLGFSPYFRSMRNIYSFLWTSLQTRKWTEREKKTLRKMFQAAARC